MGRRAAAPPDARAIDAIAPRSRGVASTDIIAGGAGVTAAALGGVDGASSPSLLLLSSPLFSPSGIGSAVAAAPPAPSCDSRQRRLPQPLPEAAGAREPWRSALPSTPPAGRGGWMEEAEVVASTTTSCAAVVPMALGAACCSPAHCRCRSSACPLKWCIRAVAFCAISLASASAASFTAISPSDLDISARRSFSASSMAARRASTPPVATAGIFNLRRMPHNRYGVGGWVSGGDFGGSVVAGFLHTSPSQHPHR